MTIILVSNKLYKHGICIYISAILDLKQGLSVLEVELNNDGDGAEGRREEFPAMGPSIPHHGKISEAAIDSLMTSLDLSCHSCALATGGPRDETILEVPFVVGVALAHLTVLEFAQCSKFEDIAIGHTCTERT